MANQPARSWGAGSRQKNYPGIRGISIYLTEICVPGGVTNDTRTAHSLAGRVRTNNSQQNDKGNMTIKSQVMSDRSDEYTGKKGLVKQQIITVMTSANQENDWHSQLSMTGHFRRFQR
jgi:hypothetical protein